MPRLNGTTRLRNGIALQARDASGAASQHWNPG